MGQSTSIPDKAEKQIAFMGPHESGKTTLLTQIRLLYGDPLTPTEKLAQKMGVYNNLLNAFREAIALCEKRLSYNNKEFARVIDETVFLDDIPRPVALAMVHVWNDPAFKGAIHQLPPSQSYFLIHLPRFLGQYYQPSHSDVLLQYQPTELSTEFSLNFNNCHLRMIDVPGMSSKSIYWGKYLKEIPQVVVFVVALDSYHQELDRVDEWGDQMTVLKDAMNLFEKLCHSPHFKKTQKILILNRADRMERALGSFSFSKYFDDFNEKQTRKSVLDYIAKAFQKRYSNDAKSSLYIHVTNALDESCMSSLSCSLLELFNRQ